MLAVMAWSCCISIPHAMAQYYPAQEPLPAAALPYWARQAEMPADAARQVQAWTAMANIYLNRPARLETDLVMAREYANKALAASNAKGLTAAKDGVLLLLGQLNFYDDAPDAIEQLLPGAGDATKAALLEQLSFYYWYRDAGDKNVDCEKSIVYARRAAVIADKLGLRDLVLLSRRNIALCHSTLRKEDSPAELLEVLQAYERTGYTKLQYVYFGLAWHYYVTDQKDKAYYYSQAAISATMATKDTAAAGDMYLIHAGVQYMLGNYKTCIATNQEAIKYYSIRSGMYSLSSPVVHETISSALDKLDRKEEAINYMLRVLRQYPPRTYEDSLQYFYRLGNACRELKRFDEAVRYTTAVNRIARHHHFGEQTALLGLGHVYLDAHQYGNARTYLYQALHARPEVLNVGDQRYLHYMLYLADSATGHYLAAIQHLNYVNDQRQANDRLEQHKQVQRLEATFKAQETERELALKNQNIRLLQKQSDTQKEKLKQSEQISVLILGGLALALLTGVLLFFLYRQKRRSTRQMAHKNLQLQKVISEKEWLLKEVHHRVKNNLHTIFCLLESQARTATPEARNALEQSQHRIYAMSLFHQKVYQSADIEQVDFGNYIREFLLFVQDGFDLEARNIRVSHRIEQLVLPLHLAMPLALVANEALTNAAKYAFVGRASGEISLLLHQDGNKCRLVISDNGIGLPESANNTRRTLGMDLMHGLCGDIGATIHIDVKNGTRVSIDFKATQVVNEKTASLVI